MLHRLRNRMAQARKASAQALVEFAIAATVIFLLLAAAVDLGLIYMMLQSLHNAAQEGASYGSRWLKVNPDNSSVLDYDEIRRRVRSEAGETGRVAGINLTDLNNDGQPDDAAIQTEFIEIKALADKSLDGDPTRNVSTGAKTEDICTDPSSSIVPCYVQVRVKGVYRAFFPFATVFGAQREFSSTYLMPIRSTYARSTNGTPTFEKATPTAGPPTPEPLSVRIILFIRPGGNSPWGIKARVMRGDVPVTGAAVRVTVDGQTFDLSGGSDGYYANCALAGVSGGSPRAEVFATDNGETASNITDGRSGSGSCT